MSRPEGEGIELEVQFILRGWRGEVEQTWDSAGLLEAIALGHRLRRENDRVVLLAEVEGTEIPLHEFIEVARTR